MKKLFALMLALPFLLLPCVQATAGMQTKAAAVLLMEKESGTVLYEENADEKLPPASVTKVMTLLLIMEAVDGGRIKTEDIVTTSAQAASMGGSQVFLKENEQMSVQDMLKAIALASGNDASVAMAEHLFGSEAAFVEQMNAKAAQLGMENTVFQNCTGLPAQGHYTSARDIALMSRELMLKHPTVRAYTTIWMDTLRGGAFQLANTNKLIYYYPGATGLKTGSTDSALYCLSATAERDGMELIAVVLGAPSSTDRFETAKSLLSFGFANYSMQNVQPTEAIPPVRVHLGEISSVQPVPSKEARLLLEKSKTAQLRTSIQVAESVQAPVEKGQTLGELTIYLEDTPHMRIPLIAPEDIPRLGFWRIYEQLLGGLFLNANT